MFDAGVSQGPVIRKKIYGDWEKWFAWRPVKIHGDNVWLQTVYRRYISSYVDNEMMHQKVEYGTLFDVIKEET